jgi:hypothetical protein
MTGANSSSGIISLGKNEKSTTVLSPLLLVSRGFFVAQINVASGLWPENSAHSADTTTEEIIL